MALCRVAGPERAVGQTRLQDRSPACQLAGNVTPHTLGHTAATWLMQAGVDSHSNEGLSLVDGRNDCRQHIDRRATKATVASRARLYLKAPFLHRQTLDGVENRILHHRPITMTVTVTVSRPQNTPGMSSVFRFSKMYQPALASGAPGGDADYACAKAGINAIYDKLDF